VKHLHFSHRHHIPPIRPSHRNCSSHACTANNTFPDLYIPLRHPSIDGWPRFLATEEETALLQCGERWVIKPSDANRRAVLKAAEDGDPGRAAHWVAMAAFYSDGSIAPESAPSVPPKDRVAGQSVLAGVTLTALVGPIAEAKARRKELSRLGQSVAVEGISVSHGIK